MWGKNAAILFAGFVLGLVGLTVSGNSAVLPVVEAPVVEPQNHVRKISVFGKDDRVGVPRKYRSLAGGIGLLYKPRSKFTCSAFCVAPDVIATAAHCMMSGKKGKNRPDLSKVYFYKYYPKSKRFGRRASAIGRKDIVPRNMLSDVPFNRRFTITVSRFKLDWALVKLDRPACGQTALTVKSANSAELSGGSRSGRVFQLAFHSDKNKMRSVFYSKPCRITNVSDKRRKAPKVLSHKCDTAPGSSGSPIFMNTPEGPVVIAINVGEVSNRKILRRGKKIIKRYRLKPKTNTAVNASVFAAKIQELAKADIFFGTAKLVVMQKILKKKNFYRAKIDGIYGPGMRSAILSYQRKYGLPRNGFPSNGLLALLSDGTGLEEKLEAGKPKMDKELEEKERQREKFIEMNRRAAEKNRKSHYASQLIVNRERARKRKLARTKAAIENSKKLPDAANKAKQKLENERQREKFIEMNRRAAEKNRKSHYASQLIVNRERAQVEADKKRRARRLEAKILNDKVDKRHRQKIIEKRRRERIDSESAKKTN